METRSTEGTLPQPSKEYTDLRSILQKDPEIMKLQNRYMWPIATLLAGLRPLHHWALRRISQIQTGQKVLEIGSGYPLYKLYAHKVGSSGVFIALDIDEVIQKRSEKIGYWIDKLFQRKNTKEQRVVADANELPFAIETFDTLIASNFNDYSSQGYVDEAYRVLKPGGRIISSHMEGPKYEATKFDASVIKQAGFTDVKIIRSTPGFLTDRNFVIEAVKSIGATNLVPESAK